MLSVRPLIWLAPVVGTVLAVAVYRDAYAAEVGRYAGAEPGLAGLWVAGPLIVLVLAQIACALGMHVSTTERARTACVSAVLVTTCGCLLTALALITA
ncbi:hypothetical protein [Nocardioides sp. SR21]|uniref:hypothetical protein n=1 Tax=Nocardioides sp. SR21 TaxID=2919501 RepID=UPI001FAABEAD|nr:hypothetical protein [Nocardioides sp. SR21]